MATTKVVNIPYASAEDWGEYRHIITQLYLDRDKTLKEVMEYMRINHKFNATTKMYKYRVKQWDLRKNLRYADMKQLIDSGVGSQNTELVPEIRGQKATQDRIFNYMKHRKPICVKHRNVQSRSAVSRDGPNSDLRRARAIQPAIRPAIRPAFRPEILPTVAAPDDLKALEDSIQIMRRYIAGNLEAKIWDLDQPCSVLANSSSAGSKWQGNMAMATSWLTNGEVGLAFRHFRNLAVEYEKLLVPEEPLIFIITCNSILRLVEKWPDLGHALLQQMYALSRIAFRNSEHPVAAFLLGILKLGPAKFGEYGLAYARSCVAVFQETLAHNSRFLVHMVMGTISDLVCSGIMDSPSALSALLKLLANLQPLEGRRSDILLLKAAIAWNYYCMQNYSQALSLNDEVFLEVQSNPPKHHEIAILRKCHTTAFRIHRELGNANKAVITGQTFINFCIEKYGTKHGITADALSDYEDFLKEFGSFGIATSISETLKGVMDQMLPSD